MFYDNLHDIHTLLIHISKNVKTSTFECLSEFQDPINLDLEICLTKQNSLFKYIRHLLFCT